MHLIDSHLSGMVTGLADVTSPASLIAFIEGLRFPNDTQIICPPGEPLVKWNSLSRLRAKEIAGRVLNEPGGELLFDDKNETDLDLIEAMDSRVLAKIWEAGRQLDKGELSSTMPAQSDAEAEGTSARSDAAHSTDFRSVRWFGARFSFTTTQAACVQVLWRNWQQGTPVISEVTVLDDAGSAGDRLRDVFDKGKHPAWGTLINPAGKGAFCLAEPDEF